MLNDETRHCNEQQIHIFSSESPPFRWIIMLYQEFYSQGGEALSFCFVMTFWAKFKLFLKNHETIKKWSQ